MVIWTLWEVGQACWSWTNCAPWERFHDVSFRKKKGDTSFKPHPLQWNLAMSESNWYKGCRGEVETFGLLNSKKKMTLGLVPAFKSTNPLGWMNWISLNRFIILQSLVKCGLRCDKHERSGKFILVLREQCLFNALRANIWTKYIQLEYLVHVNLLHQEMVVSR